MTAREVLLELLEHPDCTPDVPPQLALGLVLQLSALQTRLALAAAGALSAKSRDDDGPTCYDIPDVAERLKMDVSHVYKLAKRGDLVTVKHGRAVRVRREDLEQFINERANGGSVARTRR